MDIINYKQKNMNIGINTVAEVLEKTKEYIKWQCPSSDNENITYDDYKQLVCNIFAASDKLYDLGAKVYYDNSKDDALAIPLFERAAKEGELRAVVVLAEAYAYGFGVEKNADKCVEYLQRGIDADSPFCYYLASKLMEKGEILVKDLEKSFRFMKIATDKNYMNAMLPLANKYLDGIGTQKNLDEGKRYLKIAAENGNEEAKKRLKEIEGPLNSYANEAERKYRKAAETGDVDAQFKLGLAYYKG